MAKYLDYDGLSKLWSKIGDRFVKKTGNKSESITGDKKFTGTTTIGGTNIYSAIAQVLGTNQNVTSFSGNKILFKNGATFEGTALDAGLCTRGICGTDTGGTSKSELYLNYDGNNNYSRKVVLGAGSTGESLGTNCGYMFTAIRGDEMKNYVKAAVESYPGVNKKGTVTSIKLNTTYTSSLRASSAEEISTSGTFNLHKVSKTGSYNDLNNKPNAVTYSTSGSNHYLWAFGGRYKISAPGTLQSDGTYKDVTIIANENLSSQGLFVPMVGTGSTPMSGGIQIKGEYEGTNASSGPISGGSGQTHTSPRNADLSLGLKGISYHYYGNDNTYGGSSGLYTDGVCYKAKETSGGSYSKLDYLLDAGLTVFQYSGQSSANPALSNVKSTTITYDGKLTLREGTTTTIKSIKNLVETGDLGGYQKTIGSNTDVTMRTLSFKNGFLYSISGIYCTEINLTLGGSVGNEASTGFTVSSSYQSSFANGTWYFVACPTSGSWINTMCFGITDKSSTGGKLWVKRALSASQSTYKFTIIMVRLY